jgi:hypothetical protein
MAVPWLSHMHYFQRLNRFSETRFGRNDHVTSGKTSPCKTARNQLCCLSGGELEARALRTGREARDKCRGDGNVFPRSKAGRVLPLFQGRIFHQTSDEKLDRGGFGCSKLTAHRHDLITPC